MRLDQLVGKHVRPDQNASDAEGGPAVLNASDAEGGPAVPAPRFWETELPKQKADLKQKEDEKKERGEEKKKKEDEKTKQKEDEKTLLKLKEESQTLLKLKEESILKLKAELLGTLLKLNADPQCPPSSGTDWSPLHSAIMAKNPSAVTLLLEAKADTACPGAKNKGCAQP